MKISEIHFDHIILIILIGLMVFAAGGSFIESACRKEPKVGEVWITQNNHDGPFESTERHVVTILDVKEGWIRYEFGRNQEIELGGNERDKIGHFYRMYEKYKEPK